MRQSAAMDTPRPDAPRARALLLAILLPALALAACAANGTQAPPPPDDRAMQTSDSMLVGGTIYLARHAETVGEDDTRRLSEEGRARAEALADALQAQAKEPIERIFSTDYPRTLETARPIADRLGLEVELYDPSDLSAFAERLKSMGQTVLVVGHSNTTPALVELLGGAPGPPIDEPTEHDRLYRVEVPFGETVVTRYGT